MQPDWLYDFFRGPITIRPWLDVRMPTFGLDDAHWNDLLDYFAAVSDVTGPFSTHEVVANATALGTGEELFELLRCQLCHVLDTIPEGQDPSTLAPDLRMARERLQPDWVLEWMIRPLDIQPGTNMPTFFTEYPGSCIRSSTRTGWRRSGRFATTCGPSAAGPARCAGISVWQPCRVAHPKAEALRYHFIQGRGTLWRRSSGLRGKAKAFPH